MPYVPLVQSVLVRVSVCSVKNETKHKQGLLACTPRFHNCDGQLRFCLLWKPIAGGWARVTEDACQQKNKNYTIGLTSKWLHI